MDTETTSTTETKQVTVDVPEDRIAEFYAWYGRFLSGRGRRRRRGPHGRRHHCRADRRDEGAESSTEQQGPTATV